MTEPRLPLPRARAAVRGEAPSLGPYVALGALEIGAMWLLPLPMLVLLPLVPP